jgi:hypothetical protein
MDPKLLSLTTINWNTQNHKKEVHNGDDNEHLLQETTKI